MAQAGFAAAEGFGACGTCQKATIPIAAWAQRSGFIQLQAEPVHPKPETLNP